ncbi:unnamed protein product [Linum trigynum]|uniref:Uncharacterized protein n=1 Tax=Linum trigynum TaxID=586398 RepID=A0AAV2C673_9ROSI
MLKGLNHWRRIGSIDFIICGEYPRVESVIFILQNRKKMAFRKNRPKSVMALWDLPKIDPEDIRSNRCLMDLIIVEEYPQTESVICILLNPW